MLGKPDSCFTLCPSDSRFPFPAPNGVSRLDPSSLQAIHGFRETEKSRWSEASRAILQRVQAAAFGPGQTLLSTVHVLDLEPRGYIKPHVDSVKVGRGQHLGAPSWGWTIWAKA